MNQTKTQPNGPDAPEASQSVLIQSESRRKALATCVGALLDVQQAYQDMFDIMPVAWQTYDNIVKHALDKSGVLDTGGRRTKSTGGIQMSAATKQAPPEHTPTPWQTDGVKINMVNPPVGGGFVARMGYPPLGKREANAELVCRAVNAFGAAQKMAESITGLYLNPEKVRAALRAWEEANKP